MGFGMTSHYHKLREHAELVGAGIPNEQAARIVGFGDVSLGMEPTIEQQKEKIYDSLHQTLVCYLQIATNSQIDELLLRLDSTEVSGVNDLFEDEIGDWILEVGTFERVRLDELSGSDLLVMLSIIESII